jgi:hypothetical protein
MQHYFLLSILTLMATPALLSLQTSTPTSPLIYLLLVDTTPLLSLISFMAPMKLFLMMWLLIMMFPLLLVFLSYLVHHPLHFSIDPADIADLADCTIFATDNDWSMILSNDLAPLAGNTYVATVELFPVSRVAVIGLISLIWIHTDNIPAFFYLLQNSRAASHFPYTDLLSTIGG